jgi:Na+-driven multidrug efflux pump
MFSNKFICKLIVPLIFEQLLAVSVGMVDTFMVSIVGQVAVSGVALVDNINRLIIQIMAAFATGGVVIASQYFGCDDRVRARHTCAQLETIMMIFSVVAALIFCVFTSPILSLIFGSIEKTGEVYDYSENTDGSFEYYSYMNNIQCYCYCKYIC